MALFDRIVKARITTTPTISDLLPAALAAVRGEGPGVDVQERAIEITGLKMNFSINKTESSDPNTCRLSIFNMNEDSRNKINIKDSKLYLSAGYLQDTGEEIIFIGNLTNLNTVYGESNVVTTVEAADGELEINEPKISVSFKQGASAKQMLDKVLEKIPLPVKIKDSVKSIFEKKKFSNGQAFMGAAKFLLNTLTKDLDVTWSVQNNEIKMYENNSGITTAIELTIESGLVGSPTRIKIKPGTKGKKKEVDGWRVTSLLMPLIEPGSIIQLQSREIKPAAQFKVLKIDHSGDSFEGKFESISEVIQL
jgi:hypothetical protein